MSDSMKIIEHFGHWNQRKKFMEEAYEVAEALQSIEDTEVTYNEYILHLAEEIADVLVLLDQFIEYNDIDRQQIEQIKRAKVKRTLKRIEEGYYE